MHEDPKQHHCSIYFRILLVACSHHPVHATFSADLVLLNLFPRDNYLWHPWANLLGILLPTSDNATLSAMCGSQLVQWPASRLPPHCRSRPRAQLLVQEWHRYRRDQQHVWLLMCATETVCLLSVLSVPDFPNTLLGQFSEKKTCSFSPVCPSFRFLILPPITPLFLCASDRVYFAWTEEKCLQNFGEEREGKGPRGTGGKIILKWVFQK